jgi:type I restriction enzyme S subunit
MSKVKAKRLGDLINLKRGYDLPESQRLPGPYPVISSAGISGYHNKFKVEGEGVVTGRYGTLGEMYYVDGKYWPHNTALYVTNFKGNNPRYIYYLLSCLGRIHTSDKSAVPGVNRNELHEMAVPAVEDKIHQKKIAAILSALDTKIELNNRINAELEAMAQTLYDYWFVQFDFPDHNGRPYKSSGGRMAYNATLKREIPEGWSSINVGKTLGKVQASRKIPNKEILNAGDLPVIDQSTDYICGFTNDFSARVVVNSAHIIFGDHTRILKLVNFDYARGADGTQVMVSKLDEIPQHLFYQVLKDINLSSYGYARHFKFLKDSLIILPNKDVAIKYEAIAHAIYRKVRCGLLENQQLTQIRDWLLPMLMNAQVTVA